MSPNTSLVEYQYSLPEELIAQRPENRRDESRVMVLERDGQRTREILFRDLLGCFKPGDVVVVNDTRVFPARLWGKKEGLKRRVEILLLKHIERSMWRAMVRPGKRLRPGTMVSLPDSGRIEVLETEEDGTRIVVLKTEGPVSEYIRKYGETPLPPYIHRQNDDEESYHRNRYQTVYARHEGSVAAPTAGLHFTDEAIRLLQERGVEFLSVTLHVGAGTFQPVREQDITRHKMHSERYSVSEETARKIESARRNGRRIIAVGTTTTRTLEHVAARNNGEIVPDTGESALFIYPGFRFQVVDGLLTNFHLPGSTLLMLVSAFAGREWILDRYKHAVSQRYRFYSYGDCMLIL